MLLYYFYFNFILAVYTGQANFDFNQRSIFTECCVQLRKRFEWSKSLHVRLPPPYRKIPPGQISQPHPLPLNAIWKTLEKKRPSLLKFVYFKFNSTFLLKIFFSKQYHDIKNALVYNYSVHLRIQFEYRKIWTRKIPYLDTFHALEL